MENTIVVFLTSKDGMKLSSLDVIQFALSFIRQALANLAIGKPLACAAVLTLVTQALSAAVSLPEHGRLVLTLLRRVSPQGVSPKTALARILH